MAYLLKKKQMYMLTEEENVNINSTKDTQLKAHEDLVNNYNSKKNSLNNITEGPREKWEDDAHRVIDKNKYLSMQWKIVKVEKYIKEDELKLRDAESLSDTEKKEIEDQIKDNKTKLQELTKDIQKAIQTDLLKIKNL